MGKEAQGILGGIGGMLQGAAQGLQNMQHLEQFKAEQEMKRKQLELQQQELDARMQEQQAKQYDFAAKRLGTTFSDILMSPDPEASVNLRWENMSKMMPILGIPLDQEQTKLVVKDLAKVAGPAQQKLALASKDMSNPSLTMEARFRLFNEAKDAFNVLQTNTPRVLQPVWEVQKQQLADAETEYKAYREQAFKMEQETAKAAKKKDEALTPYQEDLKEFRVSRAADTAKQQIYSNPVYKKLADQEINASFLTDLVKEAKAGNQVAANSMGAKAARSMGEVGVLTETDVARYVQGRAIDRKVADKLKSWIKGVPTDMTLDEIVKVQGIFEKQYALKVQPIVDRQIETFAINWLGAKRPTAKSTPEEVQAWQSGLQQAEERLGFKKGVSPTLAVPQSGGSGLTPEQRQKRIQELKAKLEAK